MRYQIVLVLLSHPHKITLHTHFHLHPPLNPIYGLVKMFSEDLINPVNTYIIQKSALKLIVFLIESTKSKNLLNVKLIYFILLFFRRRRRSGLSRLYWDEKDNNLLTFNSIISFLSLIGSENSKAHFMGAPAWTVHAGAHVWIKLIARFSAKLIHDKADCVVFC